MQKILIIGSGGREHALAWKLSQSPRVGKIFCAPGNAGTALLGENVAISEIAALIDFARREKIALTVVGPDDALAAGVVDAFQQAGLRIFGPPAAAARLESSKAFAKDFMRRHGIPTAAAREFTDSAAALDWCREAAYPLVIKADGLALGKGVVIAENAAEAAETIHQIMDLKVFGASGDKVVIEEFLRGVECSLHALVDGSSYCLFPDAKDHKRALDGDQGLNTGGMGTISPSGALTPEQLQEVGRAVMEPFMKGIKADGIPFRGLLFPGLMMTDQGPKVLEFNCRFGDPETQVFMRRLQSDLLDLLDACVDGTLDRQQPAWDERVAVCVILASGGYPGSYEKGKDIRGLDEAPEGVVVFHAGTKAGEGGRVLTNGGRVLGVSAMGADLAEAGRKAYAACAIIGFDGMHFRRDIGRT